MIDHAARAEDVRWMLAGGENLTGAAKRIGISADGLEKWLRAQGMVAELHTLQAREPYLPTDQREQNRRNAEARWAS